ncbi:MAG: SxtJ family membrane protein [Planctomycetes bacterium]|nr:SxtJ family membrane protein [Planctomycetota bacterium]
MTSPTPDTKSAGLAADRPRTGAAVVPDLYRAQGDPAAERARLRGEARKLGVAFFVFFSLIIGGLSLVAFNGALRPGVVVTFTAPAGQAAKDAALAPAAVDGWRARWSDGQSTPVDPGVREPDLGTHPGVAKGLLTPVRVQVVDAKGGRATVGSVHLARRPGAGVTALELPDGTTVRAAPSFVHAVRTAKLLGLVPTHCLMSIGALLGLVGVVLPAALVPFYRFWMGFVAAPLGWFNTRLILGVVFYLMFTPMALVLWLKRRARPEDDPLGLAERPGSYWRKREKPRARNHFERTF